MLLLTANEVETFCEGLDVPSLISRVLELHALNKTILPAEAYLGWAGRAGGRARTLNMPGYIDGNPPLVGTKIINGNADNVMKGLARASGITILFDPQTARPRCLMDAAFISATRTAAITLVCARALQRSPRTTLALFGAGVLAKRHILLLSQYLDIDHITVFDVNPDRTQSLLGDLAHTLPNGVLRSAVSVGDALEGATLVVAATTTAHPYIFYDMLSPGCLLINVSLDDFGMDVFENAEKLYVDDIGLVQSDEHRILGKLIRAGIITMPGDQGGRNRITGTIGDLLLGNVPGRTTEEELILVNPFGMAIEDIVIADAVYQGAMKVGLGVEVILDGAP